MAQGLRPVPPLSEAMKSGTRMDLALFDLDGTLLEGDSDRAWRNFMVENGWVSPLSFRKRESEFLESYALGMIDYAGYISFLAEPLQRFEPSEFRKWQSAFLQQQVIPMIRREGQAALGRHRSRGDRVALVTATASFIAEPIARLMGVEDVICTQAQEHEGKPTGLLVGLPCFREGKCLRVREWEASRGCTFERTFYYGDSAHDIPLLGQVSDPVAVTPDTVLAAAARRRGWPIVDWSSSNDRRGADELDHSRV